MKIGLCGTGRMGGAIVLRLLETGHDVTVWNRDMAKTAPLVEAGAKAAPTPSALAQGTEVVISMLLNADAIEAVYTGADGLLSANLQGKLVIDMSTVLPETEEHLAERVRAAGGAFVECPVGGTVGPARTGKLFGFVGGADADVERAHPLLEQLCARIEHVGPPGAGARLKLAVNLPLLVYWQALGEALSLAKPLGLAPERLIDILSNTSGTPTAMKMKGLDIAGALGGKPLGPAAFDVTAARKDLTVMRDYAQRLGVSIPTVEAALRSYDEVIASGQGGSDAVAVPVYWSSRK
ncbi:MAG: NAD(P)-dependent oxidoreductase [Hyphomicrobiales bacterium]|jgi:3-hydroxyisobutyrate dehydrogenase|nr:NAD(P)-dependent oxidoreductase [Hyphomicrobiales bacterium]